MKIALTITVLMILSALGIVGYAESQRQEKIDSFNPVLCGTIIVEKRYFASGLYQIARNGCTEIHWQYNGDGTFSIFGIRQN